MESLMISSRILSRLSKYWNDEDTFSWHNSERGLLIWIIDFHIKVNIHESDHYGKTYLGLVIRRNTLRDYEDTRFIEFDTKDPDVFKKIVNSIMDIVCFSET